MFQARARLLVAVTSLSLLSSLAWADGVHVRGDLDDPGGAPFPSNRFTVFDAANNTLRRVSLTKPDCSVRAT